MARAVAPFSRSVFSMMISLAPVVARRKPPHKPRNVDFSEKLTKEQKKKWQGMKS